MRSRFINRVPVWLWLAPVAICCCMGQNCNTKVSGPDQPPLAIRCPELVHGCTTGDQAQVVVSVHVARTEHTALTVTWSLDGNVVKTDNLPAETPLDTDVLLTQTLVLGNYMVHVEVNDGTNPVENCDIPVKVLIDSQPPQVTCSVVADSLWPPNHKLQNVGLSVDVTDDCDLETDIVVKVYSDEPVDGEGDGSTDADAVNIAPDTLGLRGERSGGGNGRVYLIVVTATDDVGKSDTTSCTVFVPHDQSADSIDSANGQAAAAKAAFDANGEVPAGFVLLDQAD